MKPNDRDLSIAVLVFLWFQAKWSYAGPTYTGTLARVGMNLIISCFVGEIPQVSAILTKVTAGLGTAAG